MIDLNYTLLPEGSSDKALVPILNWMLQRLLPGCAIQSSVADLRYVKSPPKTLADKIRCALDIFPCQILFIHRDADSTPLDERIREIDAAKTTALESIGNAAFNHVCVVPVRMMEAWLLIDEPAIREASGNPNGQIALDVPRLRDLEGLPDPKRTLYGLLRQASECSGRRLIRFRPDECVHRLVELIDDFSPLCSLPAFEHLKSATVSQLRSIHYL